MKIIKKIDSIKSYGDIVFVPTMGALHEGHLSIVEEAKKWNLPICMSIFVNKLQFNNKSDFEQYPRDIDRDIIIAKETGVKILFLPESEYLYEHKNFSIISSGKLGMELEGKSRPGHFDGVLSIVDILLQLVQPKYAIFCKKDSHQFYLISSILRKRHRKVNFLATQTVRELDGLALSSRNALLSSSSRKESVGIFECLKFVAEDILKNKDINSSIQKGKMYLQKYSGIVLEYLVVVDSETFKPPIESTKTFQLLIAVIIDGVRLIDNISFYTSKDEYEIDFGIDLNGEKF